MADTPLPDTEKVIGYFASTYQIVIFYPPQSLTSEVSSMKKLWNFICSYSTIIKIIGRLIIFICLIILLADVFGGAVTKNRMESIPWAFIIAGVTIYCIGWIADIFERRKKNRSNDTGDESTL